MPIVPSSSIKRPEAADAAPVLENPTPPEEMSPADLGYSDPQQTQYTAALAALLDDAQTSRGRYARKVGARRNVHLNMPKRLIRRIDDNLATLNDDYPGKPLTRTGYIVNILEQVRLRVIAPLLKAEADSTVSAADFDPRPLTDFKFNAAERVGDRKQVHIPMPILLYSDFDSLRDLARRSDHVPDLSLTDLIIGAINWYGGRLFIVK